MTKLDLYIGLLRPKTLFSGISAVLVAIFYAIHYKGGNISYLDAFLLLLIASLAQIASNVANDLIDFKKGSDTADRKGPLRPLSKGLLTIKEVKNTLYIVLALLLMVSAIVIFKTSVYLIFVGIAVLLGIFAYSGGPYPLSRNGLGELAVIVFFGWIPTIISFYVLTGVIYDIVLFHLSTAIGLASANILLVNNYRDYKEDYATGKRTIVVKFGRDFALKLYPSLAMLSIGLLYPIYSKYAAFLVVPYAILFFGRANKALNNSDGEALNKVLAMTAMNVFVMAIMIGIMLFL